MDVKGESDGRISVGILEEHWRLSCFYYTGVVFDVCYGQISSLMTRSQCFRAGIARLEYK